MHNKFVMITTRDRYITIFFQKGNIKSICDAHKTHLYNSMLYIFMCKNETYTVSISDIISVTRVSSFIGSKLVLRKIRKHSNRFREMSVMSLSGNKSLSTPNRNYHKREIIE